MSDVIPTSAIEDVITYMTLAKPKSADPPLSAFDGALPFYEPFMTAFGEMSRSGMDVFYENAQPDICGHLDVTIVKRGGGFGTPFFRLWRATGIGPLTLKSMGLRGTYGARLLEGLIDRQGDFYPTRSIWTFLGRGRGWRVEKIDGRSISSLPTDPQMLGELERTHHNFLRIAPGIQLTLSYEWQVRFKVPGAQSIRLPAAPDGIFDLFAERDVSVGKLRRDALIHWVQQHLRRNPRDPDKAIYVREHLRGKTDFFWNGFECQVQPSADDLRRARRPVPARVASTEAV